MIVALKKKYIIVFILFLIILVSTTACYFINVNASPKYSYTIVIDAGHGGIDGGVVGFSGENIESDLTLKYARCLSTYFSSIDVNIVLTRTTRDGLYSNLASNKKQDDMKKRQEIISSCHPNLVLSLHMNGYILPSQKGIMTYYKKDDEMSKTLATTLQDRFKENLPNATRNALVGDYYILNCTRYPSVLVECGFLTNEEEEKLLITDEYMNKVCFEIFTATFSYLVENAKLVVQQ